MSRAQRNFALGAIAAGALLAGGWLYANRHGPVAPTEIYRGVSYQCIDLHQSGEASGLMHVVIADLTVPGVSVYVPPMDEAALARGFEYRLDYVSRVVRRDHLAAAINAGYFAADSRFVYSAGDFAISSDVTISDHRPCHIGANSYLVWIEDDGTPHIVGGKPPGADAIRRAKWGVSAQIVILSHGVVSPWAEHNCDKRTLLGIDAAHKRIYLAVFEHASTAFAAQALLDLGATDAVPLDGGGSTTMALGSESAHDLSGTMLGGWRPVATMIGIRAEPIQ